MLGDLNGLSDRQLLDLNRRTLQLLRDRGRLESANPATGQFGEELVHAAYGGRRLGASTSKGVDVIAPDGTRIEVKTRVREESKAPSRVRFDGLRSWEESDLTIGLVLRFDFSVDEAWAIESARIPAESTWIRHTNCYMITLTALRRTGTCVTDRIRGTERSVWA